MHFTSYFPALTAITAASALAVPAAYQQVDTKFFTTSFDETSLGAIYFQTNEPTGNYLVSASIGADGTLTPTCATSSQGLGGHGLSGTDADPLFSQGAVAVSQKAGLVASVNAGSNTVQLYSINPLIPAMVQPLGAPLPSGGDFPTAAAFSNDGNMLCVLNAGFGASVRCFGVSAESGLTVGSTRSLGLNTTTPPIGVPTSASTVHFTPDDTSIIALVKGTPAEATDPAKMMSWSVTSTSLGALAQTGALTNLGGVGSLPFSLTEIPGKQAFLASDAAIGVDVIDYSAGLGPGSVQVNSLNITGQSATCWSVYSPKSGNFYVSDVNTNYISEITVGDDLVPSLVSQFLPSTPAGPTELVEATINGENYVYALFTNTTSVGVMRIDGPANMSLVQSMDFALPSSLVDLTLTYSHVFGMGIYVK